MSGSLNRKGTLLTCNLLGCDSCLYSVLLGKLDVVDAGVCVEGGGALPLLVEQGMEVGRCTGGFEASEDCSEYWKLKFD